MQTVAASLLLVLVSACAHDAEPVDGKEGFIPTNKADVACDYNWVDSAQEGRCPERWLGGDDGCDCGCQVVDPDCDSTGTSTAGAGHTHVEMRERNWVDLSENEFSRVSVPPPFPRGRAVQPGEREYAIVERLQSFLDTAFDQVRAIHEADRPGEPFFIPRPRVRVVPAESPNGWIGGVGVCLRVSARIDVGDSARPRREAEQVILFGDRLSDRMPGRSFGAPREPCVTTDWSEDAAGYVEFFNQLDGPCQLAEEDGGLVIEGDGCRYSGTATHVDEVVVLSTAPFVNLTSEMIVVSEQEEVVVATILHELGHYVLAHPLNATLSTHYNHWFEQTEAPALLQTPVDDSARITARLSALSPSPRPSIPGQSFSPRMTRFVVSALGNGLLQGLCEDGCACQEAVDALDYAWTSELSCFGCSHVSAETEARYLAYEEALRACADDVMVSASHEPGTLSLDALMGALRGLEEFLPVDYETRQSLSWWLSELQQSTGAADAALGALHAEIADRHLGQYTAEQHADDFSLEIRPLVGLAPHRRVEAAHFLTRVRHDVDSHAFERRNGFTFEWFDARYQNEWRDEEGYVFIPLGELHDTHHGMPYRVFNLSRELEAHGYVQSSTRPELPHTWAEVLRLAEDLRGRVPPPRPFSPAPPDPDDPSIVDGDPPILID